MNATANCSRQAEAAGPGRSLVQSVLFFLLFYTLSRPRTYLFSFWALFSPIYIIGLVLFGQPF